MPSFHLCPYIELRLKLQEKDNISQWLSPPEANGWNESIMFLQDIICSEISCCIKMKLAEVTPNGILHSDHTLDYFPFL